MQSAPTWVQDAWAQYQQLSQICRNADEYTLDKLAPRLHFLAGMVAGWRQTVGQGMGASDDVIPVMADGAP